MCPTKRKHSLNTLCAVGELENSIKGLDADADFDIDDENDDEESDYMSEGGCRHFTELVMDERMFKLIYGLGVWDSPDDKENKRIAVATLLTTWNGMVSDLNVNLVGDGQVLEYTVFWASALINM